LIIPEAKVIPEANPRPPLANDVVLAVKTSPDVREPDPLPVLPETVPWNNPEPEAPD